MNFRHISQLIKRARHETRLMYSQAELAHLMGFCAQLISNVERGLASIPAKHIVSVSDLLGIPYDDVIQAILNDYEFKLRTIVQRELLAKELKNRVKTM